MQGAAAGNPAAAPSALQVLPGSGQREGHAVPFTEPAVRLALTCSWKMANTMMLGSTAMVMAANMAV